MKLKFQIAYDTQWGESLHVVLCYKSHDSADRVVNLTMQTSDGNLWTVETAVIESRQHPIDSVSYHYQVEDGEGRVLRREWTFVPRAYHFDPSKDYFFPDSWRDRPLCSHLYSLAYNTTLHLSCQAFSARRLPLYRKTVVFRVSAPQLLPGQSLALIGSHPMLGGWNTARYLRMDDMGCREWMLSVNADAIALPVEYKYVVVDNHTREVVSWEVGDNRVVEWEVPDGKVLVVHGDLLRLSEKLWRLAGVAVPVFSLRSEHSFGVGDFGDLRRMVDWAVATGMKMIQTLPVNDTTTDGRWHDSYPYNIVSCFALHPHYMDLEQLGELSDKTKMTIYRRRQRELNALPYVDYEAVGRVKSDYIADFFAERGDETLQSDGYNSWRQANMFWLQPYVLWRADRETERPVTTALLSFTQYHLHLQLLAAAAYAREQGVALKGDLPIGVNRDSVETKVHPELFNIDCQTGAPPDAFSPNGQNWGFPTYNWDSDRQESRSSKQLRLTDWLRTRCRWMEQYFDAVRVDHVLGFFRVWEIPDHAVYGVMGHFSPSLPLTSSEIEYFGLPFRRDLYTLPFVNDRVLERLFGIHADYVRSEFLLRQGYGLYGVKSHCDTQRKVERLFEGRTDENSLWIKEGMMRLLANVLFLEDPRQPDMYHPRIGAWQEPVFDALSAEEKDAYMRLYNSYFYQRHSAFWGQGAMHRLGDTLGQTPMLVCAEDLGMVPDCVAPVLDTLRILTLELQTMPKVSGYEFAHLDGNPYRSVATISTHDMAPLRLWWEESRERSQRYFVTMLQKEGRAPEHLPAHLAEEIIARHLYCPSMLCLLSLQDWLAMDGELRAKDVRAERINTPADPYNRWQWRMHLTIEQLLGETRFNNKLKTMIERSKRSITQHTAPLQKS